MKKNISVNRDLYSMILNTEHRCLKVVDTNLFSDITPLKKVYPSTGCFFKSCPFPSWTCNICHRCF